MKINLENYESLALSEGYGAILMIHEYGQQHPEDRALVISGGTETHVKLQMVRKYYIDAVNILNKTRK